jgi:hypothetical protein
MMRQEGCKPRMRQSATGAAAVANEGTLEHEMVLADGTVDPHKGTFYAFDRQVDVMKRLRAPVFSSLFPARSAWGSS